MIQLPLLLPVGANTISWDCHDYSSGYGMTMAAPRPLGLAPTGPCSRVLAAIFSNCQPLSLHLSPLQILVYRCA